MSDVSWLCLSSKWVIEMLYINALKLGYQIRCVEETDVQYIYEAYSVVNNIKLIHHTYSLIKENQYGSKNIKRI